MYANTYINLFSFSLFTPVLTSGNMAFGLRSGSTLLVPIAPIGETLFGAECGRDVMIWDRVTSRFALERFHWGGEARDHDEML